MVFSKISSHFDHDLAALSAPSKLKFCDGSFKFLNLNIFILCRVIFKSLDNIPWWFKNVARHFV